MYLQVPNCCKRLDLWLADESECILVASVDTNWDIKVVQWGVPVIQKLAVCGIVRLKYASKKDNHVTIVTTWHVTLSQSNAYCNNHTVAHFCRYFRVLGIFGLFRVIWPAHFYRLQSREDKAIKWLAPHQPPIRRKKVNFKYSSKKRHPFVNKNTFSISLFILIRVLRTVRSSFGSVMIESLNWTGFKTMVQDLWSGPRSRSEI